MKKKITCNSSVCFSVSLFRQNRPFANSLPLKLQWLTLFYIQFIAYARYTGVHSTISPRKFLRFTSNWILEQLKIYGFHPDYPKPNRGETFQICIWFMNHRITHESNWMWKTFLYKFNEDNTSINQNCIDVLIWFLKFLSIFSQKTNFHPTELFHHVVMCFNTTQASTKFWTFCFSLKLSKHFPLIYR